MRLLKTDHPIRTPSAGWREDTKRTKRIKLTKEEKEIKVGVNLVFDVF